MTAPDVLTDQADLLRLVLAAADDTDRARHLLTHDLASRLDAVASAGRSVVTACLPPVLVQSARVGITQILETEADVDDEAGLTLLLIQDDLASAEATPTAAPSDGPAPAALFHSGDGLLLPYTVRRGTATPTWTPMVDAELLEDRVAEALRRLLAPFPSFTPSPRPAMPALDVVAARPDAAPAWKVGVPVALDAIAAVTGLPAIDRPLLALGALTADGAAEPLPENLCEELLARRPLNDVDLLLPGARGWILRRRGGEVERSAHGTTTWEEALALLWGATWTSWSHRAHAVEIEALGWRLLTSYDDAPLDAPVPDTEVRQVAVLRSLLRRRALVVGGPAASGKTTITRLLLRSLRDKSARNRLRQQQRPAPAHVVRPVQNLPEVWDIAVLSKRDHLLPDRDSLLAAGEHALALVATPDATRRLLVLDDLLPIGDGDVDAVAPYVADGLGADVLLVLEYETNSLTAWTTDRVTVVPSIVSNNALTAYVDHLSAVHHLDRAAGLAAISGEHPVRDLRALTTIMAGGVGAGALDAMLGAIAGPDLRVLAGVAAASLTRLPVTESYLAGLAEGTRRTAGVTRDPGADAYRIADSDVCRTIIRTWHSRSVEPEGAGAPPAARLLAGLLYEDFIGPMHLTPGEPGFDRGLVSALACVQLHGERLCRELVTSATSELQSWISNTADSAEVARLILTLPDTLGEATIRQALTRLVDEAAQSAPIRAVTDIRVVAQAILRHRALVPTDSDAELYRWLGRNTTRLLSRREGTAHEALALLNALERLHDESLDKIVADLAVEVVHSLDPRRMTDYHLVIRVIQLQRRARRFVDLDEAVVFPIDQETAVQRLLTFPLDHSTPFEIVLGQLMLQCEYRIETWDALSSDHAESLVESLRHTSAHAFADSLNQLHSMNPLYCNALLKQMTRVNPRRFVERVRSILLDNTTVAAAAAIRAVARSHSRCARDLLFDSGTPNAKLIHSFVRAEHRDPKGLGMLLAAVEQVDEVYAPGSRFGTELAEAIGREWTLDILADDPRPSVKYHLMRGIWGAAPSFREEGLEVSAEVLAYEMRTSSSEWSALLALRLAEDDTFGESFVVALREAATADDMLRAMSTTHAPALGPFHRLARTVFPETCARFAASFSPERLADVVSTARGTAVAEGCREVARTLADGGKPGAGAEILEALAGTGDRVQSWADRLGATSGGEFVQLLALVRDVDHQLAVDAVDRLARRRRSSSRNGRGDGVLTALVRRAIFDDPVSAAQMLAALQRLSGEGRPVLDILRERHGFAMRTFAADLRTIQAPSQLYQAARAMAWLDVTQQDPYTSWMAPEFRKDFVGTSTGPRALLDLVRTIALWSPVVASEAIDQIDMARLRARVRWGNPADVDPTVDLAAIAWALGRGDTATAILDELGQRDATDLASRLSTGSAVRLVRLARLCAPALLAEVAGPLGSITYSRLEHVPVALVRQALAGAGHVAYELRRAGYPRGVAPSGEGLLSSARATGRAAWLAWSLHWVPRSTSTESLYRSAIDELYASPSTPGSQAFPAVAIAASKGMAGSLTHLSQVVRDATFRELLVLSDLAADDDALRSAFAEESSHIATRLAHATARTDFAAWELRETAARRPSASDEHRGQA